MRKVYYIFNNKTRTYDRVYPNMAQKFLTRLRSFLFFVIFGHRCNDSFLIWHFG